jgi:hypothetical protein
VVSFGPLGILGRVGWFCREADVELLPSLAGYRGLKDPEVVRHFNSTFIAIERDWGDIGLAMANFDLRYEVAYLGDAADNVIRARLNADLPVLFYLWSPHALHNRYSLNRIQLPEYRPLLFEQSLSDYPTDVVEKVASRQLAGVAEKVANLYSRFQISNYAQEIMLAMIDTEGLSVMEAACTWMQKEENEGTWQAWIPPEQNACNAGNYAVNETSCAPCPPGSVSVGGAATACRQCTAGASARPPLRGLCTPAPFLGSERWVQTSRLGLLLGLARDSAPEMVEA